MAITQVQKTSNTSATSSVTATYGATPTAGNLLVACVDAAIATGNDPTITGWSSAIIQRYNNGGKRQAIFYKVAGASESTAVQCDLTNATIMELAIFEYSGITQQSPLDVAIGDAANSTSSVTSRTTGTTAATALASELAIATVGVGNSITNIAWTNSFLAQIDTVRCHVAHKILAATGTQESTMSWTTARIAGGIIATFKSFTSVTAALAASLGALSASATATVEHPATLTTSLGALTSSLTATSDHPATLASPLGSLVATVTADVEHPATLTTSLGGLTATTTAVTERAASLAADLGPLTATFTATVGHSATLDAPLGALTATVTASVTGTVQAILIANLGALTAVISAHAVHMALVAFTADVRERALVVHVELRPCTTTIRDRVSPLTFTDRLVLARVAEHDQDVLASDALELAR